MFNFRGQARAFLYHTRDRHNRILANTDRKNANVLMQDGGKAHVPEYLHLSYLHELAADLRAGTINRLQKPLAACCSVQAFLSLTMKNLSMAKWPDACTMIWIILPMRDMKTMNR